MMAFIYHWFWRIYTAVWSASSQELISKVEKSYSLHLQAIDWYLDISTPRPVGPSPWTIRTKKKWLLYDWNWGLKCPNPDRPSPNRLCIKMILVLIALICQWMFIVLKIFKQSRSKVVQNELKCKRILEFELSRQIIYLTSF